MALARNKSGDVRASRSLQSEQAEVATDACIQEREEGCGVMEKGEVALD